MAQSEKRELYHDGIGSVQIIDTMGDEFTPAEDARTSTDKGRLGPEKDTKLQDRLMRKVHTSPFESVIVKVEAVVPLFVLREIDRHRTLTKTADDELVTPEESGRKWFARNEMSGRYVQMPDQYYHPACVRSQSTTNKQGGDSYGPAVPANIQEEFTERGKALTSQARQFYDWAISYGVERGLARIYNPINQYTKIRMTGSLKNWLDFLKLRLPSDVLWECRRVAEELHYLLAELYPSVVGQWEDYVYDAVALNGEEVLWLEELLSSQREHVNNFCAGAPDGADVIAGILKRLRHQK